MTVTTGDNNFGVAVWIVDPTLGSGTHTTITTATASASSGQTIFIRPGTYTENFTAKAGVNYVAFTGDAQRPNVNITGKITISSSGNYGFSNLQLQTNSDFFMVLSAAGGVVVNLNYCDLEFNNNNGISLTGAGAGSLNIVNCTGNIVVPGITPFVSTQAFNIFFDHTSITNSGASTTSSTLSAGVFTSRHSYLTFPITSTGTAVIQCEHSNLYGNPINSTMITHGGSGSGAECIHSNVDSGTASAISIGTGATMNVSEDTIVSSNTNAITGAGTINYSGISFRGTSSTINTTTQSGGTLIGGKFQAPSLGYLGELIESVIASGSAVAVASTASTNVTSISVTSGIWNITGMVQFAGNITGVACEGSISTTSGTRGTQGDTTSDTPTVPTSSNNVSCVIAAKRFVFTTTTTVYLVAYGVYTVGSMTAFGRISAVRSG